MDFNKPINDETGTPPEQLGVKADDVDWNEGEEEFYEEETPSRKKGKNKENLPEVKGDNTDTNLPDLFTHDKLAQVALSKVPIDLVPLAPNHTLQDLKNSQTALLNVMAVSTLRCIMGAKTMADIAYANAELTKVIRLREEVIGVPKVQGNIIPGFNTPISD